MSSSPLLFFKLKYVSWLRRFGGMFLRKRSNSWVNFAKIIYSIFFLPINILGDILFLYKRLRPINNSKENVKKILIVKVDQLGDVLFSSSLIPALNKEYPDAVIDYLVNEKSAPLLQNIHGIRKIHSYGYFILGALLGRLQGSLLSQFIKSLRYMQKTLRDIRVENYDLILNARAHAHSITWFLYFCNGKHLRCFDISTTSFFADSWASYDLDLPEHLNFFKLVNPNANFEFHIPYVVNPTTSHDLMHWIQKNPKSIVITPVTYDREKSWSPQNWRTLIQDLLDQGFSIAICGIPEHINELMSIAIPHPRCHVFSTLLIKDLAHLIKNAKALIGIESFPIHLALAVNTPLFVLIDSKLLYLPTFSKKQFFTDGRSMIPMGHLLVKQVFELKESPQNISTRVISHLSAD